MNLDQEFDSLFENIATDYGIFDFDSIGCNNSNSCMSRDSFALDFSTYDPSWKMKPMFQWTSKEVMNFIFSEVYQQGFPCDVNLEKFESVSGYIFHTLTQENCMLLCNNPHVGELIFRAKETYVRSQAQYECVYSSYVPSYQDLGYDRCNTEEEINRIEPYPTHFEGRSHDDSPVVRRPGRPKTRTSSKNEGKRTEKIWEFLIHLLKDERTCPNLVKWEDQEEGTFKFVQTEKVAQLWGSRKKNGNMTYEKFSRAMRYYYKSKILLPVPGKRLVYKFGPQAKGWRLNIPSW